MIKLSKAIEIIDLNLKEAGKNMPPDVKATMIVSRSALKRFQTFRQGHRTNMIDLLEGEAEV